MAILKTENLTKTYGSGAAEVTALHHVNLSIEPQEFVAIMGPSGCGKSTLMHLLGGLDNPTEGRVLLDNTDISKLNDTQLTILRRERIGFVFQFFNLIPVLTVRENVALPLVLDGKHKDADALSQEWLDRVGLADLAERRPFQLSGGQQQRVALARALVTDPAIILADEPTGNLDSRAADEVLHLLRKASGEWQRTVVMVTHSAQMAAYADRIVFLKDGTVVDDAHLTAGWTAEDEMLKMSKLQ
jgi:putative ABC transport system ATP-binding protein